METSSYSWWQTGIIYQIYPRSYQDSNGDSIGDIPGILSRLDYLKELGISIIWLSPVYRSPMKDLGYDISDYCMIDPVFGSMDDLDNLIGEVHKRNMKLLLDLVPNHTSDQHPWFMESASSRNNDKRNWYIWADPSPDGGPPNNWLSVFDGSAWEWDNKTHQYYYHAFLKEQPDLNYREPKVIEAMMDVIRFWLQKGVDGFRIDVLWHLIKDNRLVNNPVNPNYQEHMPGYETLLPVYSTDQPEVHDLVKTMRNVMEEFDDRMMIGEVYLPIDKLITYYGVANRGVHLPFNFILLVTPWDALSISSVVNQYMGILPKGAWPNWVLGNHDQPRIRSRIGLQQARIAAMLLLTLPGTPTMYYGDEIGMQDVFVPHHLQHDPQGLNMPEKNISRDPCRTPMQWDATQNAGFSTHGAWLPLDKNYVSENVASESQHPDSMLSLYKRLIVLRNKEAALQTGEFVNVYADRQMFIYIRETAENRFLIALNFSHRQCGITLDQYSGSIEAATNIRMEQQYINGLIGLSGDEGIIVRLDK